MTIEVAHISKKFGRFTALDDVSLDIAPGELVALLGPSGSGKTTLLRVIAGLERPDAGTLHFNGEDTTDTPVKDRGVGFVFQHYALFRHMTIFENVAFGLRVRPRRERLPETEIRRKVHELLSLVQLDWLSDRYPHQLSGGQRQRIALARALAVEPRVLLLDEPFGALDAKVRKELRRWLRRLHDDINLTSVFVTHDQEEALEVADRVVVFNNGRIEQIGRPDEIYDHPATPFVVRFIGHVNAFRGIGGGWNNADSTNSAEAENDDSQVTFVRPHDIEILASPDPAAIAATLDHAVKIGPLVRLEMSRHGAPADTIEVELKREAWDQWEAEGLTPGKVVFLKPRRVQVFGAPDGSRTPNKSHEKVA